VIPSPFTPRSHQWTDLHQNWHVSAVSARDVPFLGLDDDQSRLRVQTPKTKILGREKEFQAKSAKKFQSSYYLQNYAPD